ncbi:MAG: glycosyltransferase [Clostridium sp.]
MLNKQEGFYRSCMEALKEEDADVIMAVECIPIFPRWGAFPNFRIEPRVDQLPPCAGRVFITHCGMNSVVKAFTSASLLCCFPSSPKKAVARRTQELGAGILLKNIYPAAVKDAVRQILEKEDYRDCARRIGDTLRKAGGAAKAADGIEAVLRR